MSGFYDMNGRMYGLIPIFGIGNFFIRPKGVLLTGAATIGDNGEGMLTLTDFTIQLMIDSLEVRRKIYVSNNMLILFPYYFQTNIQGMLLGGDLSDLLNEVIQDIVPSILRNFPEGMSNLLSAAIFPMANRFLATRTMEDLLNLLFPRAG